MSIVDSSSPIMSYVSCRLSNSRSLHTSFFFNQNLTIIIIIIIITSLVVVLNIIFNERKKNLE